jgi:hypothetical protein
MQILYSGLPEIFGRFLYDYLLSLLGAHAVSEWSQQLTTAICDQGDGLAPCE